MDFNEALNQKASDIEKPPLMPQGTYVWEVTKVPAITTSKSGEWDIAEFLVKAIQAEDDVDEDDLAEFGAVTQARNKVSFMFSKNEDNKTDNENMLYRLKSFLTETLGIEEGDLTLKELMADAPGKMFLAQAVWRPDRDWET